MIPKSSKGSKRLVSAVKVRKPAKLTTETQKPRMASRTKLNSKLSQRTMAQASINSSVHGSYNTARPLSKKMSQVKTKKFKRPFNNLSSQEVLLTEHKSPGKDLDLTDEYAFDKFDGE